TSGDTITLTINPALGYRLKTGTLKYNDGTDHTIIGTSFIMPTANVTVSAEFELVPNEPAAVTGITLNKSSMTIVVGSFENLIYSIEPSNAADKSVIWFSSNTSVATVDTLGIVTGVSAGTATITVTTNDGGKTAACIVTVIGASHGDSNTTDLILTVVETTTGEGVLNPALGGIIGLAADVVVNIPGGALLGNSNITVTVNRETTSPAVSPDLQPLGDVYHFQVGGAAHYTFAKPITLSFNFNPSTVPVGANPAVFYYDDQAKKWVNIGGVVTGSTITITIDHFSQFTVMAIKPMLQFTDLNNHWAEDFVNKLIAKGVINGYPDGSFKPEQTMTRAEFITVVARAFSLTTDEAYTLTYQDEKIIPTWAKSYVTACAKAGVLPSIWGNKLNSNNNITRAEIVYIVGQAMKIKIAPNTKLPFKDQIPSWAAGYVQWAVDYGIIIGYPNKTFKPNITATRAEACAILSKTLDK
ncbi:MAG: S-layer homology domain-containing protein, partial [Methylocystaceae bacterium]